MSGRGELISALRLKTGYPERGANGTARLVDALKYALNEMWGDMPEGLLQEEWRFRYEPVYSSGTLTIDPSDTLAFQIVGSTTAPSLDGTLRGRWIEVLRDGKYHYRRVRDVWFDGQTTYYVIIDKPWDNASDSGLTFTIFTYEYPYPGDVQLIRAVIKDPENQAERILYTVGPNTGDEIRLRRGWRNSGDPTACQRGDFYQEPPPHYTPLATVLTPQVANQTAWGHNALGAQQVSYGAAGTFSYLVCHVWGRRVQPGVTQESLLEPWYISAPSPVSAQVTTTWSQGAINLATPDVHYLYGYGPDTTLPSYNRHGTEKWIFRARHATEDENAGTNNATHKRNEDDEIYYLWRVVEASVENIIDRGDDDPVDKRIQVYSNNGHFHLRFDSRATDDTDVLLRVVRRPPNLEHDADTPRIPPEATDALIFLASSYLVGERDGNPSRTAFYRMMYDQEMIKMRSLANMGGFVKDGFGDGISSTGRLGGIIPGTIQEG
jgi:hypothetical protein